MNINNMKKYLKKPRDFNFDCFLVFLVASLLAIFNYYRRIEEILLPGLL